MTCTLGIDIGTFESKGVLVDAEGTIIASASHPHRMQVPQSGWAEHDAEQDWWGDFVRITRTILAHWGGDPRRITGIAASAIGPCMLPVDDQGKPQAVPALSPTTPDEVRRFNAAKLRRQLRQELDRRFKAIQAGEVSG